MDRKFRKTLCIQIFLVWVAIDLAVSIRTERMPPSLAPAEVGLCQGHFVPLHAGAGGCVTGGATAGAGAGCDGAGAGADGAAPEGAEGAGADGAAPGVPEFTGAGEVPDPPLDEVVGCAEPSCVFAPVELPCPPVCPAAEAPEVPEA